MFVVQRETNYDIFWRQNTVDQNNNISAHTTTTPYTKCPNQQANSPTYHMLAPPPTSLTKVRKLLILESLLKRERHTSWKSLSASQTKLDMGLTPRRSPSSGFPLALILPIQRMCFILRGFIIFTLIDHLLILLSPGLLARTMMPQRGDQNWFGIGSPS